MLDASGYVFENIYVKMLGISASDLRFWKHLYWHVGHFRFRITFKQKHLYWNVGHFRVRITFLKTLILKCWTLIFRFRFRNFKRFCLPSWTQICVLQGTLLLRYFNLYLDCCCWRLAFGWEWYCNMASYLTSSLSSLRARLSIVSAAYKNINFKP